MARTRTLRVLFRCLILLSVLAVALAGCTSPTDMMTNPAAPGRYGTERIGIVLPTFNHPFFLALKRGLEERANELGLELDVRDGQHDDVKQIGQVETLIKLGCCSRPMVPAVRRRSGC